MRLTVCAKYFMPKGGAQTFLIEFTRFLVARGHTVRVLALRGEPMEGVEVKSLGEPAWLPGALRDWAHARRLAAELDHEDADVIFGEQKMWGCHVVRPGGGAQQEYEVQYVRSHEYLRPLLRLARVFSVKRWVDLCAERRAYRHPRLRRVIANSNLVRRDLLRYYPELEGRIAVVHNGSNLRRFDPANAARWRPDVMNELGWSGPGVNALFVGHDFRRKGLRPALEAVALARRYDPAYPLRLIVLGKGKVRRYRRVAERLGIAPVVAFVGGSREAERYYAAADVFIFPSFFDPCANVTLEALSAGLPVVTTACNGGCEVLTHARDGWVISEPRDVAAMANHLLDLRDPARLEAMKRAARETAVRNSMEAKMEAIVKVLEGTLDG